MSSITARPSPTPIEMFVIKLFVKQFWGEHKKERESTSPFAVTNKVASRRIVDNPITKGSWTISPVHSSVSRGFFGGIKGFSASGGGGGGSIDTKVQFDNINLCPITGKEFLDSELQEYKDRLSSQCKYWAKKQIDDTSITQNLGTMQYVVRFSDGKIKYYEADLLSDRPTFKEQN